ncbi:MAG: hypothetical protein N2999_01690 [Proteobacteria bacterium]|nr:hypothetical protein [Pseudomonadota bacterium]
MKRLLSGLIISILINTISYSEEIIYDFDIKRGFEIIGTEERPRVIFFIPELKLPLEKKDIDMKFILKDNLMEKDIENYIEVTIEDAKIK